MYHLSCQVSIDFYIDLCFCLPIFYICIYVCFLPRKIYIRICIWNKLRKIDDTFPCYYLGSMPYAGISFVFFSEWQPLLHNGFSNSSPNQLKKKQRGRIWTHHLPHKISVRARHNSLLDCTCCTNTWLFECSPTKPFSWTAYGSLIPSHSEQHLRSATSSIGR